MSGGSSPAASDAPDPLADAADPDAPALAADVPLPADDAAWREFFRSLPPRDLFRTLQKDKWAMARIFAGFRPSVEMLKNPVVAQRLLDEAQKQPKFAKTLVESATPPALPEAPASDTPPANVAALTEAPPPAPQPKILPPLARPERGANDPSADAALLKAKVKEQRTALRDREARIAALEADLAAALRDRDTARTEAEAATSARRTAEADAQRRLRQQEKDAGRKLQAAQDEAQRRREAEPAAPVAAPVVAVAAASKAPLDEALQRLLRRGRYATVAEICREALATGEGNKTAQGRIHSLLAAALYAQADLTGGQTEDRAAAVALLDAGDVVGAAHAMAQMFTQTASAAASVGGFAVAPRATDGKIVTRLLALADKTGQVETVRGVFNRMRIGSPDAYRRLRGALNGGEGGAGKRASGELMDKIAPPPAPGQRLFGPDDTFTLSTVAFGSVVVSPRRIVEAVSGNDTGFIARVRDGLFALRLKSGKDIALADTLLESVAALDPTAILPLQQNTSNPIVVDASNVARHNPDPLSLTATPRVANLRLMRNHLLRQGFFPVLLIADANLRFHVDDRATYLEMVERQMVQETGGGTSADETLIAVARDRIAPLVTNDRLAEWGDAARQIERFGFAILPTGISLTAF